MGGAGYEITSAQALATLPIATVAGRTYQVFYDVAEGSSNINVSLGSSAAYNSSNASANQNDGTGKSLATAYTADDATSFLALQLTSSTNTHYCDVDNLKIVEVGLATGWTDADQQLDIPQTALQSYNQLAWFDGYEPVIIHVIHVSEYPSQYLRAATTILYGFSCPVRTACSVKWMVF